MPLFSAFAAAPPLVRPAAPRTALSQLRHTSLAMCARSPPRNPARTAAITGASGGIGLETARALLTKLPHLQHLYLLCRNPAKADAAVEALSPICPRTALTVVPVELASPSSVATCAADLLARLPAPLDLLVCNAGIMAPPLAFTDAHNSAEGPDIAGAVHGARIELQYAVNHLAHAQLAEALLPSLRAGDGGRIVFVSSMAAALARNRKSPPRVRDKVEGVVTAHNYARWPAYADSKLAMAMYARALARREGPLVECVSLHPGVVQTDLARYILPSWAGPPPAALSTLLAVFGFKTPEQGARLSAELSTAARGHVENGAMFVAVGGKKAPPSAVPLLGNLRACQEVLDDTLAYVSAL